MSDVISLIRLRRGTNAQSLSELELQAKERFASLPLIVGCDWENDSWSYLKLSQKVHFKMLGGEPLPKELITLSKVFLVNILWNQRLRAEPYSFSHIRTSIEPIKIWAEMGFKLLSDINQEAYDALIVYLGERYAEPATNGVGLNRVINYLNDYHLLSANIDTVNIRKAFGNTDEFGRVQAKKDKMPLPELVKAVIHLKWAVDERFDGSTKAINDKLCILTQVFQYGLGLRLGEVLRLPLNPLIEIDGEVFCLVWTEKGSEPMARYVPTIWRKPFKDAVDEIHKLTKVYRDTAIQFEQSRALSFFDERFDVYVKKKESSFEKKVRQLDELLLSKKLDAEKLWQLKIKISNDERFELKELASILPISSGAKNATSLLNYYINMGFKVVSESLGTFKNNHYVTGEAITKVIDEIVSVRATHVTVLELLKILNICSTKGENNRSKDTFIREKVITLYGNYIALTYANDVKLGKGPKVAVISREDAIDIIRAYTLGGYDHHKQIPLKELESILPEFFNQNTAGRTYLQKLGSNEKVTFYVASIGKREFIKTKGYLADFDKVKNYFQAQYERMNLDVERELIEESIHEYELADIEISSKSFSIRQKPSEHLFLRAGMNGGQFYEHLPQILGYRAVTYFFGGNHRQDSAFVRYEIDVEPHIADSWQSHKGRHWQTTSLFRAGLAELVVNKWMGRTTGQGENYDHNTGRERAKVVGDAMLNDSERFLGDVPDKVRMWKQQEIPTSSLPEHLTSTLQSIQYGPLGYCTRPLYLKPCEFNLKCLTGNEGKGCKHYIYDLHDPSHREKITVERDRSSQELSRLFEVYEKGVEAAKMHIEHHMVILRNTTSILDKAEIILNESQLDKFQDFMPFKKDGSFPDDCPFQCGGNE
ncbi:hypothetical protein Q6U63_000971 [Vibrio fluvialis]|nr:hypothetical protein [Vibrio fluvialis]